MTTVAGYPTLPRKYGDDILQKNILGGGAEIAEPIDSEWIPHSFRETCPVIGTVFLQR